LETFGKIDSKYRYVIIAAKRAKQLLKGAKPKIKTKTKNPIRIAQLEVKEGVIEYDILHSHKEDILEGGEQVFIADDLEEADEAVGVAAEGDGVETDEHPIEEEEAAPFDEDFPEVAVGDEKDET